MTCTLCHGPFHPATGHYESEKRMWCGACARGMYKFLKEQLPRRVRKYRFYDYATVPPPAKINQYRFCIDKMTPEEDNPKSFKVMALDTEGVTVEEAYLKIVKDIPQGYKMWCWMQLNKSE